MVKIINKFRKSAHSALSANEPRNATTHMALYKESNDSALQHRVQIKKEMKKTRFKLYY